MLPTRDGALPITAPQPAFESNIHKSAHPLSPKRRNRYQLGSSEQYLTKLEDEYNHMTTQPRSKTPPLYAKLSTSSNENFQHGPRGWGSRKYPSHDLESGASGSDTVVTQRPKLNTTGPIPIFDDSYFHRQNSGPRIGRWQRFEMRYRCWLDGMTQRRRTKLVFQVVLAGMIVGILLGLAFGVTDE
ncbi:hypothetical protein FQN49_004752 [Arthroderma sp. PD_2]|nr:hypothetical protein FQN49_004752 [Arthroderma sp. PD_2]